MGSATPSAPAIAAKPGSPLAAARASSRRFTSTPDRLRLIAAVTVLVSIAAGVLGWWLADRMVTDTETVAASTGEVLVVNQQVQSSYAEAHAAAVAVHLAGADGDRDQRRLYEEAIERAASGLEQVAAAVGDDPVSHEALQQAAARTTRYVALVESARSSAIRGDAQGDAVIADAGRVTRDRISPQVDLVDARFQDRLADQTAGSSFVLAAALFLVVAVALGVGQYWLYRRFRRIVNPPLVVATLIALACAVYCGWIWQGQQQAFDNADAQAYRSIEASGRLQQLAYTHRADENAAVLAGQADSGAVSAIDEINRTGGVLDQIANAADTNRETAAVAALETRWERYLLQSAEVRGALRSGDVDAAEQITSGPANDAFNGFNASVEALLLDNREQFFAEMDFAVDLVRWVRWVVIAAALLIAVLSWAGYSLRIREYA